MSSRTARWGTFPRRMTSIRHGDRARRQGRGWRRWSYMVMPGQATERAAEKLDLPLAREAFADRTYDDTGNLTSRKIEGAVIP